MQKDHVSVPPSATYEEVARLMVEKNFSSIPVVEATGELVGIVSEKDLFRALYPEYGGYMKDPQGYKDPEEQESEIKQVRKRPIAEFMTQKVVSVDSGSPVLWAGGLMLAKRFHMLPVVDDGKLVGIVTRDHIYRAILKAHFES